MCLYYFAWTQCASLILDGHNLSLLISMVRMFLFFLLPYDSFKHRQHDSSRSGGNRMGERAPEPASFPVFERASKWAGAAKSFCRALLTVSCRRGVPDEQMWQNEDA